MEREIICFGVRNYEIPTFLQLGQEYNYSLILKEPFLTNENVELALGYSIVMVRGNCFLNKKSLEKLQAQGLRYLLTRTAGFNHLDIIGAQELGIEVAYVPGYSPNAVAELALTLTMMLVRNLAYTTNLTRQRDFRITDQMFSHEIRNLTVGIIGMGKIGRTTAKLFQGLGARVLGVDRNHDSCLTDYGECVTLDTLLKEADVISFHIPYKKGENDNLIDAKFIAKMKDGAILINTSRGEIQDVAAIGEAVAIGKLRGAALDVLSNEKEIFFKKHEGQIANPSLERLISLYPRILLTPHIGSSTYQALHDMVAISLQNMDAYIKTGTCPNSLITKGK